MTQIKFGVDIHHKGDFNDAIIAMITNHNSGLCELTFDTIAGFAKGRFCQYPTVTPPTELRVRVPNFIMDIVEKDTHTLTITRKEIEELAPIELPNDNEIMQEVLN